MGGFIISNRPAPRWVLLLYPLCVIALLLIGSYASTQRAVSINDVCHLAATLAARNLTPDVNDARRRIHGRRRTNPRPIIGRIAPAVMIAFFSALGAALVVVGKYLRGAFDAAALRTAAWLLVVR